VNNTPSDRARRTRKPVPLDATLVDALLRLALPQDRVVNLDQVSSVDMRPFARACFDVLASAAPEVFSNRMDHQLHGWVEHTASGAVRRVARVRVWSRSQLVQLTVAVTSDHVEAWFDSCPLDGTRSPRRGPDVRVPLPPTERTPQQPANTSSPLAAAAPADAAPATSRASGAVRSETVAAALSDAVWLLGAHTANNDEQQNRDG